MTSEINQIMACDSSDKESILKDADESTAVLSSPYFLRSDDKFTDLSTKEYEYKDILPSPDEGALQIQLDESGRSVLYVSFSGHKVHDLDLKGVYVEGNVVLIEKNDGSYIRVVSAEVGPDLVISISRKVLEYVESPGSGVRILKSSWEEF